MIVLWWANVFAIFLAVKKGENIGEIIYLAAVNPIQY